MLVSLLSCDMPIMCPHSGLSYFQYVKCLSVLYLILFSIYYHGCKFVYYFYVTYVFTYVFMNNFKCAIFIIFPLQIQMTVFVTD